MIIPNNNGEVEYYYCEDCNFRTYKLSNYNRHLNTYKHEKLSNNIKVNNNYNKRYACSCGKVYKHRQGLYTHRKTCNYIDNTNNDSEIDYKKMYLKLLEKNEKKICFKKLYLKLNIDLDTDL